MDKIIGMQVFVIRKTQALLVLIMLCLGVAMQGQIVIRNLDFNKAIKRVYRELKKKDKYWRSKKIKARFVCALSISYLSKKICCVIGKVEGIISDKPRGKNGFGYDPIFIPINKKKTFGEMKPTQKYKLDHRSKAFKKIKKFL